MRKIGIILLLVGCTSFGQSVKVGTWNLEHFGSGGRGFPEVSPKYGFRTNEDFKAIASLIRDSLSLSVVALQEIKIDRKSQGVAYSNRMDKLCSELGPKWNYVLSCRKDNSQDEMQNAFLYNTKNIKLEGFFSMPVPDYYVGKKRLFDRIPLVADFAILGSNGEKVFDFTVINLHLASGQDNDENHLAAMVMVQQNLKFYLDKFQVEEKGREYVILGDLNDNPYKDKKNGKCCQYMDLTYDYMKIKGYQHLKNDNIKSTRMSKNFNSVIDHIFISRGLKAEVSEDEAKIYYPRYIDKDNWNDWREVYSDHFPLYFTIKVN